jgi:hypothetical protein
VIDPQTWPPLCGAVAGCGALLVVSGLAKLARSARRSPDDGGGDGDATAVRQALRLDASRWRAFQAGAGAAECTVGAWVAGTDVLRVVGEALMACLGLAFLAVLIRIRRERIAGDCGCLGRRRASRAAATAATPWALSRAGIVTAAGVLGATSRAATPFTLPANESVLGYAVALGTLAVLAGADLDVRTPRCGRALLFPIRQTLGEVTAHGVYLAMARSLGTSGGPVAFRRAGCSDEFWFPAPEAGSEGPRYLAISAGRTASGALAVKAGVVHGLPDGRRIRTLRPRHRTRLQHRHRPGDRRRPAARIAWRRENWIAGPD